MPPFIPQYAGIYIEVFEYNRPGPQWLPQVSLSSHTKLHHTASHTLLTQTFINPSSVSPIPSAKYTFPLYESCAIVAFRCHVGTRLIEGIIKEKEDATATYQAAVGRNEPASLLEQNTADVFTTSIGNIPAGETVKVEIEYIMELKHDAEVDGLRFTIPTSIAPRYGTPPTELSAGTAVTARNMKISVQVSMSSNIKSVQSPSHPITLHLGGHSADTPDDAFNPQHALATLGQTTTELDQDFILLIKCAGLSSPTALLEVHPTIPNSKALMVTLVPKFNLPESVKPEVVFIVDRSGSMSSRVAPLKSSLSVFLKSLPLDVNFNICSFGSHHSFLWEKSRPYSNRSFEEAQKYCDRMKADFGGTEILPAIKSTIERRLKDLNLEIMVLTDGEVWNSEELFKYVENETEKGDVRVFSLGIGRNVSHALIDGLARVGRGFSQVVSDEKEGMESKVARMLRGGLSAHVVNYRLEWEGKPSTALVSLAPATRPTRRISLFDSNTDTDTPVSFSDSAGFAIPSVIQAPYKIQPLFPFSRSTAYALLSDDTCAPSRVWLRGTTSGGDELELEIAVQSVPVQGGTIHQLAARKILQELKDGTSYVHGAVDKERQPALLAEWVKKEGVRVGLKYGVASQWTSFVAVERKEMERVDVDVERREDEPPSSGLDDDDEWDSVMQAEVSDDSDEGGAHNRASGAPPAALLRPAGAGGGASVPVMMMTLPPPPPIPYPTEKYSSKRSFTPRKDKSAATGSRYSDLAFSGSVGSITPRPTNAASARSQGLPSPSLESSNLLPLIGSNPTGSAPGTKQSTERFRMSLASKPLSSPRPQPPSSQSTFGSSSTASVSSTAAPSSGPFAGASPGSMFSAFSSMLPKKSKQSRVVESQSERLPSVLYKAGPSAADEDMICKALAVEDAGIGISYSPSSAPPKERLSADTGTQPLSSQTKSLIGLQTFEGSFTLDTLLATVLGVPLTELEAKLARLPGGGDAAAVAKRRKVWATVLAIRMFEVRLAGERGVWELVVDKARAWLGQLGMGDIGQLESMAREVLGL